LLLAASTKPTLTTALSWLYNPYFVHTKLAQATLNLFAKMRIGALLFGGIL
jgi:hypothetical protein